MKDKIMELVVKLKDEVVAAKGNFGGAIEVDGEARLIGSFNSPGTESPAISLLNAIVLEGGVNPITALNWLMDNYQAVTLDYIVENLMKEALKK